MKVCLNGQFVDSDAATLSVFDAAVQHGVGLFTTLRAYHGRVYRLQHHLDRLAASVKELGLHDALHPAPLAELIDRTLRHNDLLEARVRVTITGGDLSLLAAARGQARPHTPTVLIQAVAPTTYPESFITQGVAAVVADARTNPLDPFAGHKTIHYWARLQSLVAAGSRGAQEALWFSVTNHLCGGAVSNVFLVAGGRLLTPIARGEEEPGALRAPVLPGVTRQAVIDAAGPLGVPVERRMLGWSDIASADEVFLTNSSWLILPVVKVENHVIAGGKPGPLTGRLYQALLTDIAESCGGPS